MALLINVWIDNKGIMNLLNFISNFMSNSYFLDLEEYISYDV